METSEADATLHANMPSFVSRQQRILTWEPKA